MNILYVVPYAPNQIRVRPFQQIRALARRGHRVAVATVWSDDRERGDLARLSREGLRVVSRRLRASRSIWNCLLALPGSTPLQAAYSWQPRLAHDIRARLRDESFDVVHVEHLRGARYFLRLKSELAARRPPLVVWDSVDCISHLFEQAAVHSRSLRSRLIARLELGRTRRYENRLAFEFDRIVFTSPIDKEAFESLSAEDGAAAGMKRTSLCVVPNGVDIDYFKPKDEPRDPGKLVMTGKMSYHANVSAACHLVRDVMPHVWSERPEVTLQIVGKDPPKSVRDLAGQNTSRVAVTGSVPDLRPYLWRATAAVAPVTYGAGIQNKVLEAMSCGTPVIATPQAVSAIAARPGAEVVVAEGGIGLAKAILTLLGEPDRCPVLGRAGRAYVERFHSWDSTVAQLEEVYRAGLDDRRRENRRLAGTSS